jgi:hypothetical protein
MLTFIFLLSSACLGQLVSEASDGQPELPISTTLSTVTEAASSTITDPSLTADAESTCSALDGACLCNNGDLYPLDAGISNPCSQSVVSISTTSPSPCFTDWGVGPGANILPLC